mmetsp:Transcript_16476/g.16406  ORF Transcript_16476/g.16406 Transcript_16476/m.16406 type:complete len:159 (+) Transcript_16476:8-484(+)
MSRPLSFLLLLSLFYSSSATILTESNIGSFISGFAHGVNSTSTLEIPCITAYPYLVTQITTFENAVAGYQDFSSLLHIFKSTVNELVSFCRTCNFENTILTLQAMLTTGEGLDAIFIIVFTNFSFYNTAIKTFFTSLSNGLYYDAGTQAGIVYYKLFG